MTKSKIACRLKLHINNPFLINIDHQSTDIVVPETLTKTKMYCSVFYENKPIQVKNDLLFSEVFFPSSH